MNVTCIHRISYSESCLLCNREAEHLIKVNFAKELVRDALMLERDKQDASILLKEMNSENIARETGLTVQEVRRIKRKLKDELWKNESLTERTT